MKSYNKTMLSIMTSTELVHLYNEVKDLSGRAYNRGVSEYIIDEFLGRMDALGEDNSLDFLTYMPTFLSMAQAGMFDSLSKWLKTEVTVSDKLEPLKEVLISCLVDADNVPRTPVNTEVTIDTNGSSEESDVTEDSTESEETEGT